MAITKEAIAKEQVKRMIKAGTIELTDVIDIVIDLNGIIGVGLITLGDHLKQYCTDKIKKKDYDPRNIW